MYYLRGLFPLQDVQYAEDADHHYEEHSPLQETMYSRILKSIEDKYQVCPKGPVIEIPFEHDLMMHTRNCKVLHEYLN